MRRTTVSSIYNKNIIAKDPKQDKDTKISKLLALAKSFGFKNEEKSRKKQLQENSVIQCSLTIFGQIANVVITRNSGGLGSNSPLKIMVYIPTYDGLCGDWNNYFKGINKINQFIQKAKKIDQQFLS